ncbi:MAG: TetR/AcrR family transcriptional regulator [Bdellovibrionaceae bacterium]|nr:TetR/AcrR family transcriptional regulator [Pseudobdellovibrionaceae bacterium]
MVLKKGEATRRRVLTSAAYCLAFKGEKNTTFQAIADHCGVSQPLVVRYLKSRDNIFRIVMNDVIESAREQTEALLREAHDPVEKLKAYLKVSVKVFLHEETTPRLYLMLHYLAGYHQEYKEMNTMIKEVALARITEILEEGVEAKVFRRDINANAIARLTHDALVGVLLSSITELNHPQINKVISDLTGMILNYICE